MVEKNKEKEANQGPKPKKHALQVRKIATKKKKKKVQPEKDKIIPSSVAVDQMKKTRQMPKPVTPTEKDSAGISRGRVVSEKSEKQKKILMYFGVAFFMVLISIFWLYNVSMDIKTRHFSSSFSDKNSDWAVLSEELGKQMSEMQEGIREIREFASTSISQIVSDDYDGTSTSSELVAQKLRASLESKAGNIEAGTSTKQELEVLLEQVDEGDSRQQVTSILGEADEQEEIYDLQGRLIMVSDLYHLEKNIYIGLEYSKFGEEEPLLRIYRVSK